MTLHQLGGHFKGSSVLEWQAGAESRGVLLTGDTLFTNSDRTTVSFMRSFPNRIPLPGDVARRIARDAEALHFDRIYHIFRGAIDRDAKRVIAASAERHAAWCSGAGGVADDC